MVQDNLIDFENSRIDLGATEIDGLLNASSSLCENVVTFISELSFTVTPEKIRKMVKLMTVICFKNNQHSTFLNLYEFVFTPGIFESIFLMTEEDKAVIKAPSKRSKVGTRINDIADEVAEFIKQNGFAAQSRRRTEVVSSNVVTIEEIQSHLYKTFPALKEHTISLTIIMRLFQAPNKHFKAAERYAASINLSVGTKSNTYREDHQDV